MKRIALINKAHVPLAIKEWETFCGKSYKRHNLLYTSTERPLGWNKLAYTQYVVEPLFEATPEDFLKTLKHHKRPVRFSLDMEHTGITKPISHQEIAPLLKACEPDPRRPYEELIIITTDKSALLTRVMWTNTKSFLKRKAQHRPAHHPASIDPQFARCLINLTGIHNGTIYDPMCGVGGILIEAGLMGYQIIGSDIDQVMLAKAAINLEYYGVSHNLSKQDVLTTTQKSDAIVCDVPYCRSTKQISDYHSFLEVFLKQIATLTKCAVLVFPNNVDVDSMIKSSPWKCTFSYSYYIHKNLSKIIVRLEI